MLPATQCTTTLFSMRYACFYPTQVKFQRRTPSTLIWVVMFGNAAFCFFTLDLFIIREASLKVIKKRWNIRILYWAHRQRFWFAFTYFSCSFRSTKLQGFLGSRSVHHLHVQRLWERRHCATCVGAHPIHAHLFSGWVEGRIRLLGRDTGWRWKSGSHSRGRRPHFCYHLGLAQQESDQQARLPYQETQPRMKLVYIRTCKNKEQYGIVD